MNLEKESIIVMENVLYHSRHIKHLPVTAWNVGNIKEPVSLKNIEFTKGSLKRELLALCKCCEGTVFYV